MPTVARTSGGPGSGKTHRALEILQKVLDQVVKDPMRVGFVSFTRAARREASTRAAAKFGVKASELEKHGWFRTLHSVCHKQLGIEKGELLLGGKEDNEWLMNALDDDRAKFSSNAHLDDDSMFFQAALSDPQKALALWDLARNTQTPLSKSWERARDADYRFPDLFDVRRFASDYEAAKAVSGRLDFTDLLMRFCGRRWTGDHDQPFTECDPMGLVPNLPVWFLDEAQDSSLLSTLVFKRIIQPSTFVYLSGDVDQEIYRWAGADGSIFANWPVAKEEALPISYRCREKILTFGQRVLGKLRPFHAEREGGQVENDDLENVLYDLKPGEDVLVLARTNAYAQRCCTILSQNLTPWKPVKGGGGFAAPALAAGVTALVELKQGKTINGEAVWRMLALLPTKCGGTQIFRHGTKAWWDDENNRGSVKEATLANLEDIGATESLKELIATGGYKAILQDQTERMAAAAEMHGTAAIKDPTVRVGTMHSAKGMQADHVVLLDRMAWNGAERLESPEEAESERKLLYVTATRAKERLTIASDDAEGYPML